jgi:nucleoside 2-deoxyribosyltransferase
MKIFLISPVRLGENQDARKYAEGLEKSGHSVHYPIRDTNQEDSTGGWKICQRNMAAIRSADEVHIFYHPESQGIHFDLGVSFALGKKVLLINTTDWEEYRNKDKSFLRVIDEWEKRI